MAVLRTNNVIAHFIDGSLLKGTTKNFSQLRPRFLLMDEDDRPHEVDVRELKALFFVKDLRGNPEYRERKGFFTTSDLQHRVVVEFLDGEVIFGYSKTYSPRGRGFFLVPGDPNSNNIKVFVIRASTERVRAKLIDESPRKGRKKTRSKATADT